jgi:hypothetical protein
MICSVKPVLTEDLCVVQKEEFSIAVRKVNLTKDQAYSQETNSSSRRKSSVDKKISGRGSRGAWRQDELIGGKFPVVK